MPHSTSNRFRFGIGQFMVAIAIVGFVATLVAPFFNDSRVSLGTAIVSHTVSMVLGVGIYYLAFNQNQRKMLGVTGPIVWRIPIVVRDQRRRRFVDSFAVGMALFAGFIGYFELLLISAMLDGAGPNSRHLAGVGGITTGILIGAWAAQRRFPPSTLVICDGGVQFGSYFVTWSQLAFEANPNSYPPALILKLPRWTCELKVPASITADIAAFLQQRCHPWPTGLE